jgi:signal transduction histidine kinase/CheY-like chemotaxis protein
LDELAQELSVGAGTALITEESLVGADWSALGCWLAEQESWSDFPFILLATKRAGVRPREAALAIEQLGNVVLLERPIHIDTLLSAVSSALRVRRRQYEARGRLLALQSAEERLTLLNGTLEARIAERTEELSRANNQLMQVVAERERAQVALVQSQKMEAIGQLTGGIAHDFNNLLTVISGNLELISRQKVDDRIKRYAGFAGEASERAAKLTHQLLAFSRTQQLSLAPLSLNALVEGMNDLLDRTIGPQISKVRELDSKEPWVMADAHQLELAVLNLAINARDAMPGGGKLTIRTSLANAGPESLPHGRYGVVQVIDTGTGIPSSLLSRVFDPFFTTKPLGKGTGLGLSQVFGIAKQSGGTVLVETEEGSGTSVSIWLPLTPALQNGGEVRSTGEFIPARSQGQVLVIDDDDGVRRFIADCLELLGYRVIEASSGMEGLERLDAFRPDLVLVDFAMAGLNGLEVARAANAKRPGMPVILATGYAEAEPDSHEANIHCVLRKPFQIRELAEAIQDALAPLAA